MSIGQRYYTPRQFEIDASGVPIAGAQLFFYVTETSTPLDTYSDVTLMTPNANPVVALSDGRFPDIWLNPTQAYKVRLFGPNPGSTTSTPSDPQGDEIWTADPVGPASGGASQNISGIVGEIRMYAGITAAIPAQWYLCYGQAVSRTDFAAAFVALGTTWGAGDGTTTFNLPDLRGRGLFGRDDMGGSAANRVTAGVSGVAGATLGAVGGDQATQLHNHDLWDPTHNHTLTDPGHKHDLKQAHNITSGTTDSGPLSTTGAAGTQQSPNVYTSQTGITLAAASTGISLADYGAGDAQNMPPAAVVNMIIYLGA